jgi:hypothetical protein
MSLTPRNEISILSSVITITWKNLPEAIAVLDPKRDDCNYPMMNYVDVISNQALGLNQGQTVEDLTSYSSSCCRHRC